MGDGGSKQNFQFRIRLLIHLRVCVHDDDGGGDDVLLHDYGRDHHRRDRDVHVLRDHGRVRVHARDGVHGRDGAADPADLRAEPGPGCGVCAGPHGHAGHPAPGGLLRGRRAVGPAQGVHEVFHGVFTETQRGDDGFVLSAHGTDRGRVPDGPGGF